MEKITLDGSTGSLSFGADSSIVLYRYPAGDCDTFSWPLDTSFRSRDQQLEQIALAMSDERECGGIPVSCNTVVLPDGTEISLM